ncbi:MAG: TRAP transporter fused permease subunit [Desulfuromusa sp.]|nr:TRAP transporter fused permease subunit [Desulfuromusa sp.]
MSESEEKKSVKTGNFRLVTILAFMVGAFHMINISGIVSLSTIEIRIVHLLMMFTMLFLTKPALKRFEGCLADKIVRYVLVAASVASGIYLLSRWQDIAISGGETVPLDAWVGIVIVALVLEGARRGVGAVLALITLIFFTYPFYSPFLPGVLSGRGYSLTRMSEFLTTTPEGVYGIPIGVSSTYIIMFAIFGAFLSEFGAGDFFFQLSSRVTNNMTAAGAKTAVIFSTLLGMISGSAAGNVAVTGTLTIPMMKREGYQSHQAAAIEAVVSTGGQMMPPVMGAAAFIMAEILGIPYSNIMRAGLIPALLFFVTLIFVVHLQALKSGLKPLTRAADDTESIWILLIRGGQYILPFTFLIAMMLNGYSPLKASFVSIIVLLTAHVVWARRLNLELLTKSARAIAKGSESVITIAIACAAAGLISGTLSITGLGSKISGLIISASGGVVIVALLLTMVTAIVLGMGLPTTAAYLILATVVAPALSNIGIPPLTAHMFVFFYGCVSTITPPVALASYVAAGIADADVNKVGWTAFFYGITSYLLPFMFVFGSALLLNGSWGAIILATSSGVIGTFCIAVFVVGFLKKSLLIWQRAIMAAAGVTLMYQGIYTDLIGIALLLLMLVITRKSVQQVENVPA